MGRAGGQRVRNAASSAARMSCTGPRRPVTGVPAVADASFEVQQGTVHGVIGKNGAGKSVLMNVIAGVFSLTSGQLTIGAREVDAGRWSPRLAGESDVALIPQEPPDLPFLTVVDFLFLGEGSAVKGGFLQRKLIRRRLAEIDERLSLRVLPTDPMALLPIEVQQLLAFGKAVFLWRLLSSCSTRSRRACPDPAARRCCVNSANCRPSVLHADQPSHLRDYGRL